jgi:hypothetical protein
VILEKTAKIWTKRRRPPETDGPAPILMNAPVPPRVSGGRIAAYSRSACPAQYRDRANAACADDVRETMRADS